MWQKEIGIPKSFREIHGERSRISTLIAVYLSGSFVAGIMVWQSAPLALPWWKTALLAVIFLDIGAGVIANFSTPTNQYYQSHPQLRLPFIFLHAIHPLVFWFVLQVNFAYPLFVILFTISGMLLLNFIKEREFKKILAAFITVLGIGISFLLPLPATAFYAFAPLFWIKLFLGFSVKRL